MGWRRKTILSALGALILVAGGHYIADVHLRPLDVPTSFHVDRVVVKKAQRRLTLYDGGKPVRTYPVSLGGTPTGPKRQQGDGRTPEGHYLLDWRNPRSRFHLSLHISYPDAADRKAAANQGMPPGGNVMVHGVPNGFGFVAPLFGLFDWTDGCVAVSNTAMDEIWRNVKDGTPIEIRP